MLELNTIYNEDCLIGMKDIDDKSIDFIICDLPYGTTQNKWDIIIPFDKLWEQYNRILKANGTVALFGAEPFSTLVRMSNFDMYKYDWIWKKNITGGFLNANRRPLKIYENICIFYNSGNVYNPQGIVKIDKNVKRSAIGKNYMNNVSGSHKQVYENYPQDILSFDKEIGYTIHPTQKPVALIEYLIKTQGIISQMTPIKIPIFITFFQIHQE